MCEYKNKRTVGGELRCEGVGREALCGVQRRLRSNLFVDDGCTGKQSAFGDGLEMVWQFVWQWDRITKK